MIKKIIKVDLHQIIDNDSEGFLDLLSILATNSELLMDIQYRIVSLGDSLNSIMIEVTGDDKEIEREEKWID